MVEVCINGQENNQIFMRANSWKENEMAEALFGGLTVAGIKANLEMEFKVDMGSYIETEDT